MTEELFGQIMQRMRKVPFQLRELATDAYVNVPRTDVLACAVVRRAVLAVTACDGGMSCWTNKSAGRCEHGLYETSQVGPWNSTRSTVCHFQSLLLALTPYQNTTL